MNTSLPQLSPFPKSQKELQKLFESIPIEELFQALAKNNFSFYVEYVHQGLYRHGRHTRAICDELSRIGEKRRIMVFLPPRHSKSMTVTETFPSYFLGKNPEGRVIAVSYGDALAHRFGRANREKIREFGGKLFEIQLADDNASSTNWGLKGHRGGMISAGTGGPITGEGADLLVIDDPIKNRQEALSVRYREMVWGEWQNTLLTRLSPTGAVILTLTRWHEDDLAGRLLASEPEKWTVIRLPAEAEMNDPLGREVGTPLWPEYGFDRDWLVAKKKEVGSQVWEALYQQNPSPQEGGILSRGWWKFYSVTPSLERFDEIIQSWDMAFKDTQSSDYVVGQVWGRIGADKYLLDQVRDRMSFPVTVQAVRSLSAKWPRASAKLVEDKANGTAVISVLRREIPGLIPVEPLGSKQARAAAVSPEIEAGNVFLPSPDLGSWVHDFVEECSSFPTGTYDDQVDAMTQALQRLQKRGYVSPSVRQLFQEGRFYA